MKFTCLCYYLVYVFNYLELFYYQVEAISREISYPLGSVLGEGSKKTHHVIPFRELLTEPELSELQTERSNRTPKRKRKKKFQKKGNRRKDNNQQTTTKKKIKKKSINRRTKKKIKNKRSRKTFVKTSIKSDDQSSDRESLDTVTRKSLDRVKSRKPVDIVVHIKMED